MQPRSGTIRNTQSAIDPASAAAHDSSLSSVKQPEPYGRAHASIANTTRASSQDLRQGQDEKQDQDQQDQQQQPHSCDVLIVGAGPAGLGAALLLAQREQWGNIVVLERQPEGKHGDVGMVGMAVCA